jgi:hypothetical protein
MMIVDVAIIAAKRAQLIFFIFSGGWSMKASVDVAD